MVKGSLVPLTTMTVLPRPPSHPANSSALTTAVGVSNLMTSTVDKLMSGFIALVAVAAAPVRLVGLPLAPDRWSSDIGTDSGAQRR